MNKINSMWHALTMMMITGAAMASRRDQGAALLSYTSQVVAGGPSPYASFIRMMCALFGIIVVIHTLIGITSGQNSRNAMTTGTVVLRLIFGTFIFAAPKLIAVVAATFPIEAIVKISNFIGS